jgi:hypothetical protein
MAWSPGDLAADAEPVGRHRDRDEMLPMFG